MSATTGAFLSGLIVYGPAFVVAVGIAVYVLTRGRGRS
jgi:hypothetical protein